MFTDPVEPVVVCYYWPKTILVDFYWPRAKGSLLVLSPVYCFIVLAAVMNTCAISRGTLT